MTERIHQLMTELEMASRIDETRIADEIKSAGFKCLRCARCCKSEYGDNTVTVFPSEIRYLCEKTGRNPEDIVIPTPSEDRDREGNIHTFEWVLMRKRDCIFLADGLCSVYDCRPHICKTYPFYLLEGRLVVSECEGLGGSISDDECLFMATALKERYIAEVRESISLLERFRGFKPRGRGNVCVHDSEGEHWIDPAGKI